MGVIIISVLNNEILREVGALARCIHSINDMKYRKIKLQRGQFIFLTRVCENPGINLIDLSNILKVDKTTTTKAIQKLLEEGYIKREHDCTDKRMLNLYPSAKALEIYPLIISEENRCIEVCFNGFSQEERRMSDCLLRRMRENVEQEWKTLKSLEVTGEKRI